MKAALSRQEVPAGETAVLRVEIQWPKEEAAYSFVVPNLPLKNLALVRQGESSETFQKDGAVWLQKTFEFEVQPTSPRGEGRIEAFKLAYIDPTVQKGGHFSVESYTLSAAKPTPGRFSFVFLALTALIILAMTVFIAKRKRGLTSNSSP